MRIGYGLMTVATALLLSACAGSNNTASYDESLSGRSSEGRHGYSHTFPRPPELEPQIDFWRHVYAVWSRGQVAFHDDRHLGLIYEVANLPGPIEQSYTPYQRDFVRARRELWQARLDDLQRRITFNEPLTTSEQQLAARITQAAGREAIFGAGERVRNQRGLRERFKRGLEISGRYDKLFRDIFRQGGLPEDFAYLPHVESSFQTHARSSAGAAGVWQFTRGAARAYMTNHPALDERLDPVLAARGAARYLSDAYDRLGSWPLAVTSYNHGIGGMSKARAQYGNDFARIVRYYDGPQFGFASRNFYAEFLAARDIAGQPQRYFPEGIRFDAPQNWDRVVLRQNAFPSDLALYYGVGAPQLMAMNQAWTSVVRSEQVTLPAGTEIWLPPGTLARVAALGPNRVALTNPAPITAEPPEQTVCIGEDC
jgi:membrane-bound lytic murein transglycosylase D